MTGVRSVAIVTDSTADISPAIAEAEGVTVVRLVTTFPDGSSFRDGELSQEEFFQRMGTTGDLPTTSQPPIGDFIAAYEGLLERFASVVSIHVSGRLSGTIEAARQAAERFGERVSIVDALSVSWGVGWPVVIAARKAA